MACVSVVFCFVVLRFNTWDLAALCDVVAIVVRVRVANKAELTVNCKAVAPPTWIQQAGSRQAAGRQQAGSRQQVAGRQHRISNQNNNAKEEEEEEEEDALCARSNPFKSESFAPVT